MAGHSYLRGDPFVLEAYPESFREVDGEVFLDAREARDTQLLTFGVYEPAVRESIFMGDGCFLLRIRPELRAILTRQLQREHRVFRVYDCDVLPGHRVLLTEDVRITFVPGADADAVREALRSSSEDADSLGPPWRERYRLSEEAARDPRAVLFSLNRESVIARARPYVHAFPLSALTDG